MTRHLLKLLWNRRSANALVGLEVLVAFLVLFAVLAAAAHYWDYYRRPLGFDPTDVWAVEIEAGTDMAEPSALNPAVARFLPELRSMEPVVDAAATIWAPYRQAGWTTTWSVGERSSDVRLFNGSDTLDRVLGMELLRGRWFGPEDDGSGRTPMVVNEAFVDALVDDGDGLGQVIVDEDRNPLPGGGEELVRRERVIVGVVEEFRPKGELQKPEPSAILRPRLEGELSNDDYLSALLLKMRPGTPATIEQTVNDRLLSMAPEFSFRLQPLEAARTEYLQRLTPLLVPALIAAFLLLMVALGLTGVLWQAVTQRIRELGLRRAKGATLARIRRQILAETLLLTLAATTLGGLLVLQLPFTGWFPQLRPAVLIPALVLATAVTALLTSLAALYPSWLATRVEPAEALRWE